MASYLPSAFSLSLTARDRLPTWAEPSPSAVMAAPEPPPLRTTFTPEFFFINASFRAVQTSVMEVEPAMVRVPVSLVSEEPSGFGRGGAADLTGTASGEHRGDQGGRSHRAKNLFHHRSPPLFVIPLVRRHLTAAMLGGC